MSESWPNNNQGATQESTSKYQQVLDELINIQKNHFLNSEELVEIFDKKFSEGDAVQLLDEKGEALMDLSGKRVEPVEFTKIDRHNKEVYIKGLLHSFTENPVDLLKKISKETALLEVTERGGSKLKKFVEESSEK